jgi:hypothetical protein
MENYHDKSKKITEYNTLNSPSEIFSGGELTHRLHDNRSSSVTQKKQVEALANGKPVQRKNNTGLPGQLKSGIENLSGHSMDDVKVHYNSAKPAQLSAHAYAQGTDIHIASGQEKHLPHEAWHVVQQKQGRVRPTLQMKGSVNINDDKGLEKEADIKGEEALQMKWTGSKVATGFLNHSGTQNAAIQLKQIHAGVTGLTHLVKMVNGSIMKGREGPEVTHGTLIVIDNKNKYRSRRGPNHEIFGEEDRRAGQNYRWFKVLAIGHKDVSGENLYIRDQTFETNTREAVSERPAAISPSHRLRDPHQDTSVYANDFTRKANEMPEVYSSSVRQHIVKQWVESKGIKVIAVEEDKRNRGKNNKGVFKVKTKDGRAYVVKVAVAPDSGDYEREAKKKSEVSAGLGDEAGLFAQILASERSWHGLTLGLYPEAPGMTLGQGFADFTKGRLDPRIIIAMYDRVASQLARFNLNNEIAGKHNTVNKMVKTDGGLRAHNDANPDNILIHPEKGHVTFIDNDGLSVNASAFDVEKDVNSLMMLFTANIGVQAGLEFKANNHHVHQAQEIMKVVLTIIKNIKDIYAAKIKNAPVKDLITKLCDTRLTVIQAAFDKNKQ